MVNWNFNVADYEETNYKPIPVGDHRMRVASAEEQTSSSGRQMIKLVLEVSGYNSTIWHYLVLMQDNQKLTNQKLGEFWNSFGIPQGNFNLQSWVGKVGAARVKNEEYNGQNNAKISYFISKNKQDKLPAWKNTTHTNVSIDFAPADDMGDLPFN